MGQYIPITMVAVVVVAIVILTVIIRKSVKKKLMPKALGSFRELFITSSNSKQIPRFSFNFNLNMLKL
ncbi:hypothetical protein [Listeria cornellensis]|uniref:Uncharacterized protein n=1 Tax=Listeria cornellensis FSL F6-0969 TaxID=1265820 RepID=W7C255_9LIST|nr:hypothetical protein [Listeria cornellensis]EUJ26708.1 hypothetical protein PCORN_14384 [Listeria cornellensis FSL F6-0969]